MIEHLQRQDKNYTKVVQNLKSPYENTIKEKDTKIEKQQLEIAQLRFLLTRTEGEEPSLVYKLE